ncbi:MAG TPA: group III truncated hemoglobin [Chitinophagaceae bacterium]
MKTDIRNRQDIEQLVNTFYDKVKENQVIGHFFTDVVKVDWDKHLPKMYEFWQGIVFGSSSFSGNPIQTHKAVHALQAFSKADFDEWLRLFRETVDQLFEGEKAEGIKQRAASIATVMQLKVIHNNQFYH